MPEFLETTVDKFTIRVMKGLRYHPAGLWLREEGGEAVVGVTDLLQLKAGDVTFVDLPEPGRKLAAGESLGGLETMKVMLDLVSPAGGEVLEVNSALAESPECINSDPYGAGWLLKLRLLPASGEDGLMDDQAYFAYMTEEARALP